VKNVLAFDLGGTKIAVAVVSEEGQLIATLKEKVDGAKGPDALFDQMARMAKALIENNKVEACGVASAGPLDPVNGLLLDPTNFKTDQKSWGLLPILSELKKRVPLNYLLENDAAAAAIAESWIGAARDVKNSMTITLGTGVGVGVIANGELVRAGRNLHPEAGHMIIEHIKSDALCGCGNYGCAEAYLSGSNFTKQMRLSLSRPKLTSEELVNLAREQNPEALAAFAAYGDKLAIFIFNLIMLFAPEVVVLSGGFSSASDLFLDQTTEHLKKRLVRHREGIDMLPVIKVSTFNNSSGLIGAAKLALKAH
jgi:glucokinase